MCLKYFCQNDTNKLKYDYYVVSNFDNTVTASGRDEHRFYAFAKCKYKDYVGVIYRMVSPNSEQFDDSFYLSVFNDKGQEVDRIILETQIGEPVLGYYLFSRINKSFGVEQFSYELEKSGSSTNFKYSNYAFDSPKFKLIEEKNYPGKHTVDEYVFSEKDDDFAKILYNAR